MRLIDADEIVYESIDSCDTGRHESYYGTGILAVRKEDIDDMPTIEERKTGRWIPCSERLPEENKEVLINLAWGIDIGDYREGGWHSEWINHYDDDDVIAWMPLPEPYTEDKQ